MNPIITLDETALRDAIRAIDDVAKKHVPFATAVAFNRTGEEVLAAVRPKMAAVFTVRAPDFVLPPRQLPKHAQATKTRLLMEVALGYPDVDRGSIGARREKIFRKFSYGGVKQAQDPAFPIAIPSKELRPSRSTVIPRALYPVNLRLVPRRQADNSILPGLRRGKVRAIDGSAVGSRKKRRELGLEGIGGTFTMLDENGRPIGVFQRVGRGRTDVRALWWFSQQIRIPRSFPFDVLAFEIVDQRLVVNWEGAMALAQRTAK